MHPGNQAPRRRWFLLAGWGLLALAGCATGLPAPDQHVADAEPPAGADGFFGPPQPVPTPAQVLALDDAMRAYLQQRLLHSHWRHSPQRALLDALYSQGELRLHYDSQRTRTAAEAFADRQGNCLSLVLMTAAFAAEVGLDVGYNKVDQPEPWQPVGDLLLRQGHVNLTLVRPVRGLAQGRGQPGHGADRAWTVDFLPGQDLQRLRLRRIPLERVMAMFYNNRAAEALTLGHTQQAYWLARAGVQQDPGFDAAHNTLGVVFLRAGQLPWASRWFERVLARQPQHGGALGNLALVRDAQGRPAEAQALRQRLEGPTLAPPPSGVAALQLAAPTVKP